MFILWCRKCVSFVLCVLQTSKYKVTNGLPISFLKGFPFIFLLSIQTFILISLYYLDTINSQI